MTAWPRSSYTNLRYRAPSVTLVSTSITLVGVDLHADLLRDPARRGGHELHEPLRACRRLGVCNEAAFLARHPVQPCFLHAESLGLRAIGFAERRKEAHLEIMG